MIAEGVARIALNGSPILQIRPLPVAIKVKTDIGQRGVSFGQIRIEFDCPERRPAGSNCVLAMKAHAHAAAGDATSARRILRGLKSATNHKCMPSYDIAATHAALGEPKQMGFWLNRACNERNMKVFTLMQDPRFDQLRHHSEFKEVVDQVGLSRYIPIRAAAH